MASQAITSKVMWPSCNHSKWVNDCHMITPEVTWQVMQTCTECICVLQEYAAYQICVHDKYNSNSKCFILSYFACIISLVSPILHLQKVAIERNNLQHGGCYLHFPWVQTWLQFVHWFFSLAEKYVTIYYTQTTNSDKSSANVTYIM